MVRNPSLRRRIALVTAIFAVGILMIIAFHTDQRFDNRLEELLSTVASEGSNSTLSTPHRKLLRRGKLQ
ncbi:hypothetical protein ACSBR1_024290 [Camellia fascicularis]